MVFFVIYQNFDRTYCKRRVKIVPWNPVAKDEVTQVLIILVSWKNYGRMPEQVDDNLIRVLNACEHRHTTSRTQ